MRRVAVVCATVAFALSASPAVAKSAKKKRGLGPVVTRVAVSAPATAGGGQALSATATCPKGKRAVGGGFELPYSAAALASVILHESLRVGARGWKTTGVSSGAASGGFTVQSIVYCRRVAGKIIDVAATAQMGAAVSAPATATASCPRKRPSLLSGGFTSSVGATVGEIAIPTASYRGGRSWSFSGLNNSTIARTVTSHAYCAKGLKARPVLFGTTSDPSAQNMEGITATTAGACPGRRRLSAGGFIGSPPSGMAFPLISDSRLSGTSWHAESFNLGAAGPISVASQGICL